jgi:hypothetical protein
MNNVKTFPAEHKEFYDAFKKWKETKLTGQSPQDGVYILKANKPIHRLIGADNEGVLYIGKGKGVVNYKRVGNLVNSLKKTDMSHDGGLRFTEKIKNVYPLTSMTIDIILTENYKQLEGELILEYIEKHGELPPFNRNVPKVK